MGPSARTTRCATSASSYDPRMPARTRPATHATCPVSRLVPFVHVADIHASLEFYAGLGFAPQNIMKNAHGLAFWALARSGSAEIMFALASGPIDAGQQAVLLYMYADDVESLRETLIARGVRDRGAYSGAASPEDGVRMIFEVARPHHMPCGELRIIDPDGYCILVGQLG